LTSHVSFYGYGHPRDLHSFPTRRSSDLMRGRRPRRPPRTPCVPRSKARRQTACAAHERRAVARLANRAQAWEQNLLGTLGPAAQDRKSTRLNSSHVKISYAVFCLKKKKK